jgi:hypothetical protein
MPNIMNVFSSPKSSSFFCNAENMAWQYKNTQPQHTSETIMPNPFMQKILKNCHFHYLIAISLVPGQFYTF